MSSSLSIRSDHIISYILFTYGTPILSLVLAYILFYKSDKFSKLLSIPLFFIPIVSTIIRIFTEHSILNQNFLLDEIVKIFGVLHVVFNLSIIPLIIVAILTILFT